MTRSGRSCLALLAPLGLAACAGDNAPSLFCPQVAVLQQAIRVVHARGGSDDIAARVIEARVTGVAGSCSRTGKDMEQVRFRIGFTATNGPASTLTKQTLSYFIAITDGDRIIAKNVYPVTFDFKNGADQAVATTAPIRLRFPRATRSEQQEVLVGFQMRPRDVGQAESGTAAAP